MSVEIDIQEQGTDRESVRFLTGLLSFGLLVTLPFLIIYLSTGEYGPARIVAGISASYIISMGLLHRRRHVRFALHFAIFSSMAGLLLSVRILPVTAIWLSITAVAAFALLQKRGAPWALLQFAGICAVLVADAMSPHPLYTLSGRLNILFSYISVVILCYLFLMRVEQNQRKVAEYAERLAFEQSERERSEMARRLAGGMAHLINNEMQVVMTRGHLLKHKLPEEARADIDAITDMAMQASSHTRKLLSYAEGGQQLHQRIDVRQLVQQVTDAWRHRLPEGIRLRLKIDAGTLVCDGDTSEMEQVLNGLLENAVEASVHAGEIALGLEAVDVDPSKADGLKPGRYAKITVRDHGHGMAKAVMGRIFEPFFTTRFAGRGLGLSAIYGIIQHYGGRIAVESAEGAGALFTVWWPQSTEDDAEIHDRIPPSDSENEERI